MKMLIQTEKDLQSLQGKFILQVNSNEPDKQLMDFTWSFAVEKRLKLVIGTGFVDLTGYRTTYDSFERFKKVFNSYLFKHHEEEGKTDGGRFCRLLTSKEIDYLCKKLKEENL